MEESRMFQSQLSSIMEKLLLSAVTEINELVREHCAVLRLELSRQKQDNSTLRERLEQHPADRGCAQGTQDVVGNIGAGPQLQADEIRNKVPTEDQKEMSFHSAACRFEIMAVKSEEDPEDQPKPRVSSPEHTAGCSQDLDSCLQSSRFSGDPPEVGHDAPSDFDPSVEMQCRISLSPSGAQFSDLEFQIKRETESPDLQTESEDPNVSFDLQQGILGQMFTESGAFPVGTNLLDITEPACVNSLQPAGNQHMLGTLNLPSVSSSRPHAADAAAAGQPYKKRTVQHRTPERFTCDYCGKGFPFLSMMKGHRLSHTGERNQVCGHCGKTFIRRSHLKRHEILHLGVKPFTCLVCGRKYSRHAHLSIHMKTHNM